MIAIGQARLVVTFVPVDDEKQFGEGRDFVVNLPRLDDASWADAKGIVEVQHAAIEAALAPAIIDDLPEDEELEAQEVTHFDCQTALAPANGTDA